MVKHEVGDRVTILPPWDRDPIIVSMQPFARVAEVRLTGGVMVTLSATMPVDERFGPFPESRLASGWRDPRAGWL